MRKTFSITDKDVLDKLEQVDNQSAYIQNLILRNINDPTGEQQYRNGLLDAIRYMQVTLDTIKKNI